MFWRATSIPTPRPERSVTFSAVEKPGWKIIEKISELDKLVSALTETPADGFGENALAIKSAAIVLDLNHDAAPLMCGGETNSATLRLSICCANSRVLEPVIHSVADHVHERIT